jgi:hypothetical protein
LADARGVATIEVGKPFSHHDSASGPIGSIAGEERQYTFSPRLGGRAQI